MGKRDKKVKSKTNHVKTEVSETGDKKVASSKLREKRQKKKKDSEISSKSGYFTVAIVVAISAVFVFVLLNDTFSNTAVKPYYRVLLNDEIQRDTQDKVPSTPVDVASQQVLHKEIDPESRPSKHSADDFHSDVSEKTEVEESSIQQMDYKDKEQKQHEDFYHDDSRTDDDGTSVVEQDSIAGDSSKISDLTDQEYKETASKELMSDTGEDEIKQDATMSDISSESLEELEKEVESTEVTENADDYDEPHQTLSRSVVEHSDGESVPESKNGNEASQDEPGKDDNLEEDQQKYNVENTETGGEKDIQQNNINEKGTRIESEEKEEFEQSSTTADSVDEKFQEHDERDDVTADENTNSQITASDTPDAEGELPERKITDDDTAYKNDNSNEAEIESGTSDNEPLKTEGLSSSDLHQQKDYDSGAQDQPKSSSLTSDMIEASEEEINSIIDVEDDDDEEEDFSSSDLQQKTDHDSEVTDQPESTSDLTETSEEVLDSVEDDDEDEKEEDDEEEDDDDDDETGQYQTLKEFEKDVVIYSESTVKPIETKTKSYHVEQRSVEKKDSDEGFVAVADGVTKCILTEGSGRKIEVGDVITIHCIGYLDTNPPEKFWSTKDSAQKPFTFAVGRRQVIKGWDEGAKSMRLHERSKIKIESRKAYGKYGFEAWGIPPDVGIILELEVIEHKRAK